MPCIHPSQPVFGCDDVQFAVQVGTASGAWPVFVRDSQGHPGGTIDVAGQGGWDREVICLAASSGAVLVNSVDSGCKGAGSRTLVGRRHWQDWVGSSNF